MAYTSCITYTTHTHTHTYIVHAADLTHYN